LHTRALPVVFFLVLAGPALAQFPAALRIGRANHAFDHLGGIGGQADAAAACGATIIYTSGLGDAGYHGLPPKSQFDALCEKVRAYNEHAKSIGIEIPIGYLCATSIVKLETFDKNWTADFRAQFKTRPGEWRQQDRHGKPLPSWYGGDYAPACMNNPDWRAYERAMVRYTLETGHGGVFFDNPTVHPEGCYCPNCMKIFAEFVQARPAKEYALEDAKNVSAIRKFARRERSLFRQFRATIARDFLADMRVYADKIKPHALITCNNSLNDPSVFYSQSRTYGYNIGEMSKGEDYVVVEDMNTQPRTEANGKTLEYGPTYKMLHAVSDDKPIVAVTIAAGDYHTPPNLMRLAMAEAAANGASYMMWPTWPENQRERMVASTRKMSGFLRRNERVLNEAPFRSEAVVYLDFRNWQWTDYSRKNAIAAALTAHNIQYEIADDAAFERIFLTRIEEHESNPVLLVESLSALPPTGDMSITTLTGRRVTVVSADGREWLSKLREEMGEPSITLTGAPKVRAIVHDQEDRTIVHLYNLDVQRLSSFDDKVTPASNIKVSVLTKIWNVKSVRLDSPDQETSARTLEFTAKEAETRGTVVSFTIPRLEVSAIAIIER